VQSSRVGNYLREKRELSGLSVRAAARRAGFSEARWRQLELGYQARGDKKVPANPLPVTVVRAADALDVDAGEALRIAGMDVDVDSVRKELERDNARLFDDKPVTSFTDLPRWVWEMVAALVEYEEDHDSPNMHPEECAMRPHLCACSVTAHVPDDVKRIAVIAAQWREADREAGA
jgi:transcriptional regulator with XRE-family HTH domain